LGWQSRVAAGTAIAAFSAATFAGVPQPVGLWEFNHPQNLLTATIGRDLQLRGTHLAIAGTQAEDGAVRVGIGSYYVCEHGLVPPGQGAKVNRFSLLIDYRLPAIGPWYCFYQTDQANQNDGDCFVRANDGAIGVGQTGYSTARSRAGLWQRLIVSVDNALGVYRIYLDGDLILNGAAQPVDGRFSLGSTVLLFADENGEDAPLDVSQVAIYDVSLSNADAAELGAAVSGDSPNQTPAVVSAPATPRLAVTGQPAVYQFIATDADQEAVQARIDWGDGSDLSAWSGMIVSGQPITFSHIYRQPGVYSVLALARDARGKTSGWTEVQTVEVSGEPIVEFLTLPYLQNVKTNAITLMWELDTPVEAEVEYGLDAGYGARQPCVQQPSGFNTHIYKCVLTGLGTDRTYCYRTKVGGRPGLSGTFTTAPAGGADFAFAVWADSQGSNHGAYDADPLEPTKSMLRHMAANAIDLGIGVGDLAESGDSYSDTKQYYLDRVAGLLGRTVPWFAAWGNHDAGPGAVIRKFADLPSQDRPGFTSGYGSYSFDYAGCHFICLDNATRESDVLGWLEADLRSEANRNARFTFLFAHVPPYCELWIDGDTFYRSALVPLMEAYGVDVCFSGHTHEYSRGFRNGVYYCITGGGSWLDFPEVLVCEWDHMTVGGHHAIPGVFKPGPERGGGLVNEYVRVEVRADSFTATMIGFEPDGTEIGVLDRFSMSRNPGSHPPARPQVAGPTEVNVFESAKLVLRCSAFADPDPQDTHAQSVWRLSRTADPQAAGNVLLEGITGPAVLTWSVPVSELCPGQTVYPSVQHVDSSGQVSPFAAPVAIRLTPEAVYREDFEDVPEFSLPPGWVAQHRTAVDRDAWDPADPRSNTYLTWTVVSDERLARFLGANRINVPAVVQGNSLYAESDRRAGAQLQYLTSPDFDLSGLTNVLLVFRSNYMQNQDSLGALEYSVNKGATWGPVVYFLDGQDVVRTPDGLGIDAAATFTRIDSDGVPTADGRSATGGTYGEHILSRPLAGLAAFIDARVNDDSVGSKRLERFRLPRAANQPHVRFRFALIGTSSWFWGIDDFGLFGTAMAQDAIRLVRVAPSAEGLELAWTGLIGPYQAQFRASLSTGGWEDVGALIPATQQSVWLPAEGRTGFFRIRLAR
jgi:hypothetical protein